jgi:hypothetical protein
MTGSLRLIKFSLHRPLHQGCWAADVQLSIISVLKNLINDRSDIRTIYQTPVFHVENVISKIKNAIVMGYQ